MYIRHSLEEAPFPDRWHVIVPGGNVVLLFNRFILVVPLPAVHQVEGLPGFFQTNVILSASHETYQPSILFTAARLLWARTWVRSCREQKVAARTWRS